ncbi:MAG: hypothetical protein HY717_13845 [Planctomycetes bacterium]|nr:hypothetical protein [Planctomycetota bacterium]
MIMNRPALPKDEACSTRSWEAASGEEIIGLRGDALRDQHSDEELEEDVDENSQKLEAHGGVFTSSMLSR